MNKFLKIQCLLLISFVISNVYSQQRLDFNYIGGKDGLTENVVNDIIQDKNGFIWLATNDGLNRYDGYNMISFRYDPANTNSLSSNVLTALKVDKNGMLWIGTSDGGLNRYNPENNTFIRFQNNPADATTIASGMLDNIEEDLDGNIWLNIRNKGIDRLVSNDFKTQFVHYNTHNLGNNYVAVLKSNTTTGISKSSFGGIWVCSEKGIQRITAENNKTDNLISWGEYASTPAKSIIESDNKSIWIVYSNGSIINAEASKGSLKSIFKIHSQFSVNPFVGNVTMDIDQQNELWIGSGNGLFKANASALVNYSFGQYPLNNLPTNRILSTFIDRYNVLWLGTYNNGALNFPLNRQMFYIFDDLMMTREEKSNSFFNSAIHSVCEDNKGALWIGSEGGGIIRIAEGLNAFIEKEKSDKLQLDFLSKSRNSWLLDNNIYCLYFDSKHRLWIGSSEGLTQLTFNSSYNPRKPLGKSDFSVKYFTLKESEFHVFGEGAVFALAEDKFGTIWAAKWNGGLHRYLESENRFEVFHPNPAQQGSISHNTVRSILFEPNGEAWIGTAGGGLNKMIFPDGNKGKPYFICYKNDPKDPQSLSNNYILNLMKDKNGNLWVGTFGGGLNKLIKTDKASHKISFKRYTNQEQLPGNTIKGLMFDSENRLWATTNRDLFRMNINSGNITQLISASRFKIDEFKDNANYLFKNGYMLWGGINGLVIFSPEKSENRNANICPCLTNIFVDNKQLNPGEKTDGDILLEKAIQFTGKIELPYNKNTIELQFSGMDFSNTKGIVYKFYLDGYDNNPVISNKSSVRYTKIPSGSYKFHLNASVDGVHWCENDVVLQIRISPPFWLSIYAVLFYIILALGIGYMIYRFLLFRFKLESQIKIEQIKNEQKENINNLKLQFFTNISHELRTPLNLITNPIDSLVSDPEMNSIQLKLLKMVQHNTNRLQKLINQLLDFRKIESGVLALTLVKADILPFIHDVYRSFDDVARNKAINYRFSCNEAVLECIFDPDKIEKILYNLLSNAIKFTPANGIVMLTVSKEITSVNGNKNNVSEFLKIEVSDTGIGIKKENQDKIFQYFYQSEQNKLEKNVGTGIGLAYINNVVKVHHGTITFDSQPGEGTKFIVLLPLNNEIYAKYSIDEKTIPTQSENLEIEIKDLKDSLNGDKTATLKTSSSKKTVLIVDDNEELLSYLRIELSNEYNTLTAINGLDGIEKAKEHIPDLIISDLMMPEMDGIQMCKILKTKLETCHIPIIILTAKADETSEKEGLETGADEYLLKPIKTNLLRLRVKNLLETKSKIYAHINLKADAVEFQQATRTKDQELLDRVAEKIKLSLDATELDIMELSKILGMSRSALYKKLKQITGMSTTEYVRFIKLNEAVHLFKQNKYSIEQVTFMVGFSDTKYFRKCFKLVFGSSPSEYIKKMKEARE